MAKKPLISLVSASFLLLASHALADGSNMFLTNQSGAKTTQFVATDSVYIEGVCLPAAGGYAKIYITPDKNWVSGDSLSDISGGIETVQVAGGAEIPKTQIWQMPYEGVFDVIIDSNNDLVLQPFETQCAIGITDTGFRVGSPPAPAPTPPPAPAPSPTPPPPAPPAASQGTAPPPSPSVAPSEGGSANLAPSQLFSLDDIVAVKNLSNVRKTPGGSLLGTQTKGSEGIVVGGPVRAAVAGKSYWFWNIDFDEGVDGWVTESTLKIAPVPEPEPVEEPKKEPEPVIETAAPPPASGPTPVAVAPAPEDAGIKETSLAQVSSTNRDSLMGAIVIGLAILLGFIFGSFIIAKSLRKG